MKNVSWSVVNLNCLLRHKDYFLILVISVFATSCTLNGKIQSLVVNSAGLSQPGGVGSEIPGYLKLSSVDDKVFSAGKNKSTVVSWPLLEAPNVFSYQLAIGTVAKGNDVLDWTSVGIVNSYQFSGLSLNIGQTYYTSVRAIDTAGKIGESTSGNGWIASYTSESLPLWPTGDVTGAMTLSSGKRLIYGNFQQFSDDSKKLNGLSRLNSDGSLDSTFNIGTGFGEGDSVRDTAIQSDGKIIAVGSFTSFNGGSGWDYNRIIRLNSNGSRDSSYQVNAGFGGTAYDIKLQSDGKAIVTGSFTTFQSLSRNRIVRINTNGLVDSSFVVGTGFSYDVHDFSIQSDGKIVVAGDFTSYDGTALNRIARLNSDGTVDTGFAIGTGFNGVVYNIALQSDGKIIATGSFTQYNGNAATRIARLNTDGSFDSSFVTGNGFDTSPLDIEIQSDGKILIVGSFQAYNSLSYPQILRLNSDGSADTTFVTGTGFPDGAPRKVQVLTSGDILISGDLLSYNGVAAAGVVQLSSTGGISAGLNIGTGFSKGSNVRGVQTDGKLLVATTANAGQNVYFGGAKTRGVALLNSDGTLDNSLSIAMGPSSGTSSSIGGVSLAQEQSDGKIVLAGTFTYFDGVGTNRIVRINADGSRDATYVIGAGFDASVKAMAIQSDNKIIAAGDFTAYRGTAKNRIVRIGTNGAIDASFVIGSGFDGSVNSVSIQSDGKIIVAGVFSNYNGSSANKLIRLNSDGSADLSFVIGTGSNSAGTLSNVIQSGDGKIIICGPFTSFDGQSAGRVVRLNSDGSVDSTFNSGLGFDAIPAVRLIQADQKIIFTGSFTTFNGVSVPGVVRLNADGSLDSSFNIGSGFDGTISRIFESGPGKFLVGGTFSSGPESSSALFKLGFINDTSP